MIRRYLCLLGMLVLVVFPGSAAIAQGAKFDLAKTQAVLTTLIKRTLADNGIPSMSIALVRDDKIVWTAAFGYANMATHTPATTDTLYSTGSSFKSVTATAVLQLAEQGKLKLDAPINNYLGEDRVQDRLQSEKPVTFTNLLSMWSGLISGAHTEPVWSRKLPKTLEEFTRTLYTIRAPETKWEYNNWGYGAAGLLVQEISGVEYEKYMVDNILKPLGVTTPHPVYPTAEMVERMALPYLAGGSLGQPVPEAQVHFDVYPAGDIYLRPSDMARYLAAQLNGGVFNGHRILSEDSVREMHKPRFGGDYGFGFWIVRDPVSGHTMIHHGGAIQGQRAFLVGDLDARVGLYYMTNSDDLPDAAPPAWSEVTDAALKLLRGEAYSIPPERKGIAVNEKLLDSYVGTYALARGSIVISREGRNLVLQQKGQPAKNELLAATSARFFQRGSNRTITFEGDGGKIDRLVMEVGSKRVTATRDK
jgi:D-alanyl-D-alanine-carboxypeptidase/D-alanyl-D-alanine-endopeptidase